jgi:exosortase
MAARWSHSPQYSHGFLVPLFALYLLWLRRGRRPAFAPPYCWWGVLLVVAGTLLRLAGAYFYIDWLEGVSLLPCLAGLVVALGGWRALRWAWPALVFLVFMVPLPHRLEVALAEPLRRLATRASTTALRTVGLTAVARGNTIVANGQAIGVADACNGLSMLVTFVAASAAVVLLSRRPLTQKALVLASAVPIALVANVARITTTGVVCVLAGSQWATAFYHDWAGWFMMPLALGLLWVELKLLAYLCVSPPEPGTEAARPRPVGEGATDAFPGNVFVARRAVQWCLVPLAAYVALVLAGGIVQAEWTDRWRPSPALEAGVARLDRVPLTIGEWRGETLAVDERELRQAEVAGCCLRRYEHPWTGSVVSVLLVCGRPGPVSVHPPDACFQGAGYTLAVPPARCTAGPGSSATFWVADFAWPDTVLTQRLRVFWSWKSAGAWEAPASPRQEFGRCPALYKLYVFGAVAPEGGPTTDDPCAALLRELLPELDRALGPDS